MASRESLAPSVIPCWKIPAGGGCPAKPVPPCTPIELLLKSVIEPMTALQFEMRWSSGFCFEKNASSGTVWRGPVPKIHVTLSESPSPWHEAQSDHASADALPRDSSGTIERP